MNEYFDNETLRRVRILLSLQKALIGSITSHLRSVSVGWDENNIDIYFLYDGEISEDDQEESECVATEVLASFPDDTVIAHHIRSDFPEKIPELGDNAIFRRKESITS